MLEVELQIPESVLGGDLIRCVEVVCAANSLTCTLKGTLAKYPDSIHWHFKKAKQKGILEITWRETKHRLWFKVADNRTSRWIDENLSKLKEEIEECSIKT